MKYAGFYFWSFVYKIVIEVVYFAVISPVYSYYGLIWNPNLGYFLVSYGLFLLLLIVIPKGQEKPSRQLAQLFFFTTITPLFSFFWQTGQGLQYISLVTICSLLLFSLLRFPRTIRLPLLHSKSRTKSFRFVHLIFCISLFLTVLYTAKYGGIDMRAFNFEQVYDIREDRVYTGIWAYLVNWITKLFIPFCIIMYMYTEKRLMFILSCSLQIYFYLCTGSKSLLFSVVLVVSCVYLLKKKKWQTGIPKLYSLIIVGATVFYKLTDNLMSIGIFPVRQLIIPAQISITHYDFFSVNPKLYFSEGMIGKIFGLESPYPIPSTFLVSPDTSVNWNTGFLADAYDNAGLVSMVVYTVVFWLILMFVDSVSRLSEHRTVYTALLVYTIITLNDGALLTALFTWGLGFLMIFMYIAASQEAKFTDKNISLLD